MVGQAAASQVLRRQTMGARNESGEPEENMIPEFLRVFPSESEMERDIELKNLLGRQAASPPCSDESCVCPVHNSVHDNTPTFILQSSEITHMCC